MPTELQEKVGSGNGKGGSGKGRTTTSEKRVFLILTECALVLFLLLLWIFSEESKKGTNLALLFLYSFPAEFLVGLVPHEPVLILYGAHHPAVVVALVAVASTVMAEGLNYSLFGLFYGMPAFRAASERKTVRRLADFFGRWPFAAILIAGFTPIPFFPVRFLVVMTEYPVWKYLLGVFLARAPRFYLLALFGAVFEVPKLVLVGLFLAMLVSVNLPSLWTALTGPKDRAGLTSQPGEGEVS
jgi:membrane protein YqaA with SNARE-associated domain